MMPCQHSLGSCCTQTRATSLLHPKPSLYLSLAAIKLSRGTLMQAVYCQDFVCQRDDSNLRSCQIQQTFISVPSVSRSPLSIPYPPCHCCIVCMG